MRPDPRPIFVLCLFILTLIAAVAWLDNGKMNPPAPLRCVASAPCPSPIPLPPVKGLPR